MAVNPNGTLRLTTDENSNLSITESEIVSGFDVTNGEQLDVTFVKVQSSSDITEEAGNIEQINNSRWRYEPATNFFGDVDLCVDVVVTESNGTEQLRFFTLNAAVEVVNLPTPPVQLSVKSDTYRRGRRFQVDRDDLLQGFLDLDRKNIYRQGQLSIVNFRMPSSVGTFRALGNDSYEVFLKEDFFGDGRVRYDVQSSLGGSTDTTYDFQVFNRRPKYTVEDFEADFRDPDDLTFRLFTDDILADVVGVAITVGIVTIAGGDKDEDGDDGLRSISVTSSGKRWDGELSDDIEEDSKYTIYAELLAEYDTGTGFIGTSTLFRDIDFQIPG